MAAPRSRQPSRRAREMSIATSTKSFDSFTPEDDTVAPTKATAISKIPPHYLLPPTVPSPFDGTLDAALDALLTFNQLFPDMNKVITLLLKGGNPSAKQNNWPQILLPYLSLPSLPAADTETEKPIPLGPASQKPGRILLEYLLTLCTRTLLPHAIVENRARLTRLYTAKRNTAVKLLLRYDCQLPWTRPSGPKTAATVIDSKAPPPTTRAPPPATKNPKYALRKPLMPNIWATLIQAPKDGYASKGVAERMRHHVTELDEWLVSSDVQITGYGDLRLVMRIAKGVQMWLWLREANGRLEDWEVGGGGEEWSLLGEKGG